MGAAKAPAPFCYMKTIRDDLSDEMQQAYDEIHAMTHAACLTCPNEAAQRRFRCCDATACENARKWAALKGVTLQDTGHPTLPFMGPQGCVLAPELKPLCTMHVCPDSRLHSAPRYLELRQTIEELEGRDWRKYLNGKH